MKSRHEFSKELTHRSLAAAIQRAFLVLATATLILQPAVASSQQLFPLPRELPGDKPAVALLGFGTVRLVGIEDADVSGTGKVAIAFWPNENVTSFVAYNRTAGSTPADSLDFKRIFFPESANTGFEGYVAVTKSVGVRWKDKSNGDVQLTDNRLGGFAEAIYQVFEIGEGSDASKFDTVTLGIGALYSYTLIKDADNRFGATIGLSYRVMNVLSASRSKYDAALDDAIGGADPPDTFGGFALKAGLQISDFTFEFEIQNVRAKGEEIPGASGWSAVISTTINGSLLSYEQKGFKSESDKENRDGDRNESQ